jgi:hypothetical protein
VGQYGEYAPVAVFGLGDSQLHQHVAHVRLDGAFAQVEAPSAVVVGVFVQVYLIGSYIFGAGLGALHAHESMGFVVQGFEVLVFLAALIAWVPRIDLVLSLLLAIIASVQAGLANAHEWVGGLHPLLALVVLNLAATLALRGLHRLRRATPELAQPKTSRFDVKQLIDG